MKTENDLIVEYATENAENLEIALKIAENEQEIKRASVLKFFAHLKKNLAEDLNKDGQKWDFQEIDDRDEKGFSLRKYGRTEVEYPICMRDSPVVFFGMREFPETNGEFRKIKWKEKLKGFSDNNNLVDDGAEGWLWAGWSWKEYDYKNAEVFRNFFNCDKKMTDYFVDCLKGLITETEAIMQKSEEERTFKGRDIKGHVG